MKQCWNVVNWTPRNKLHWNLNSNSYIFIQENPFQNVIWKMAAMLSRSQYVKRAILSSFGQTLRTIYFIYFITPCQNSHKVMPLGHYQNSCLLFFPLAAVYHYYWYIFSAANCPTWLVHSASGNIPLPLWLLMGRQLQGCWKLDTRKHYCQTSNVSFTRSPNLNVSRLVLQLSLPDPLKPGGQLRMKL